MRRHLLCTTLVAAALTLPEVGLAQEGYVALGAGARTYSQTDDSADGTNPGVMAAAGVVVPFGAAYRGVFELQYELFPLSSNQDFDENAPTGSTSLTARVERDAGFGTVSAFAGLGTTNHDEDDDGFGYLLGFSVLRSGAPVSIFGSVGYADIRVDNEDSGFTGPFGRIGIMGDLGAGGVWMATAGAGWSQDYEDQGDDGDYATIGLAMVTQPSFLSTGTLTAGFEYAAFNANTEDDAQESRVYLSWTIPLGGQMSPADAARPLSVPLTPFRAASYAEVLD